MIDGEIDIAAPLLINTERTPVVDFVHYIGNYTDPMILMHPETSHFWTIFSPFTSELWIMIFIIMVLVTFSWLMFEKTSSVGLRNMSPKNTSPLSALRIWLLQGLHTKPKSPSHKSLAVSTWFTVFILAASFSSNLLASIVIKIRSICPIMILQILYIIYIMISVYTKLQP